MNDAAASSATTTPDEGNLSSPNYKLYTIKQVTLGSLFGTVLTGAILMAHNYRVLGHPKDAQQSYVLGGFGLLAVLMLAFVLPEAVPGILVYGPAAYVVHLAYKTNMQDLYEGHIEQGGKGADSGWVVFLTIAVNVVLIVAVLLITFAAI